MLVLSRKKGEAIIIANGIRVSVVSISHGRVRLAIDAPIEITVDREEIYESKRKADWDAERSCTLVGTARPAAPMLIAEAL